MKYRGYDPLIFLTVLALAACGTVMVYSSSAFLASANPAFGSSFFFLKRHLIALGIGLSVMILTMRLDYHVWRPLASPLLLISFLLLVGLLGFGKEVRGVKRWISLSFMSFQPSELAKLALVLYLAKFIAAKGKLMEEIGGFLPPLLILGTVSGLVVVQPNFGTAGAILLIGFLLLLLGGVKLPHLLVTVILAIGLFLILANSLPYARGRLLASLTGDEGYQLSQSLLGVGSGSFTGVGLGRGRVKLLFLPQPHTDFVFATVAEELGFLGGGGLLCLFLILLVRGLRVAKRAPDPFGFYAGIGMVGIIFIYTVLHVGVVLGLLPTTGLPLPFVSYGGTSLLSCFLGTGILLNISLQGADEAYRAEKVHLRVLSRRL